MRATEAITYITSRGKINKKTLTHYDPDLDPKDTEKAKRKFKRLGHLKT